MPRYCVSNGHQRSFDTRLISFWDNYFLYLSHLFLIGEFSLIWNNFDTSNNFLKKTFKRNILHETLSLSALGGYYYADTMESQRGNTNS